ncbi:MAG: ABC transporter substrate-binding protein [Gemmatimonadaceae bacterium]
MTRVVSLLPAATEIVAALGAADRLVGVTHECDHPPEVTSLPRVTTSAVDARADAADVDAAVRTLAGSGGALFRLLEERIRELAPDLILTQALCEVCAVMEGDVRALAARLSPSPRVITLAATSLDSVLEDIIVVGAALDAADEAEEVVAGARARMRRVHGTLKAAHAPRPRVAVIEWTAPPYAAGHWVPEMVRRAGGVDVLAAPGAHSVAVTADAVAAADPEVVVLAPCGYGLARAVAEGAQLLARPEWVWARERRVWAIDANAFTSRPGPRLVHGVELLARCFHPTLFSTADRRAVQPLTAAAAH